MKRFVKSLALFLALMLVLGCVPAFAVDDAAFAAAEHLHTLGLLQGYGTDEAGNVDYRLERIPNRAEALVMLIRLLGEEEEALACTEGTPFTDMETHWAKPYVAYAYAKGYTNGTGATTFSPTKNAEARMYLTFVLRALGYQDGVDFEYKTAWEKTDELGVTAGEYNADNNKDFDRGDMAIVSDYALSAAYKGEEYTLLEKLAEAGAVTLPWPDDDDFVPTMPYYTFNNDGAYARVDDGLVYGWALGEFQELLLDAEEADDMNVRYVKMAKAEAVLLESAVINPYSSGSSESDVTYLVTLNLDRGAFALDNGAAASSKTEQQRIDASNALQNKHFRQALQLAFDKAAFNAVAYGEEKTDNLRNMFTPPEFVFLSEDTTVDGVTFAAGTFYGEMVQYYLDELCFPILVDDGYDGWYDPAIAAARLDQAAEELGDSVQWPIVIDAVCYAASEIDVARAHAYKESIEGTLGAEYVTVNLIEVGDSNDFYSCFYYADSGAACNLDVCYANGWGADFIDPSTYLDTFLSDGYGYLTRILGLF